MQYNIIRNEDKKIRFDFLNRVVSVKYAVEVVLKIEFEGKNMEFVINDMFENRYSLEDSDVNLEQELQKTEKSVNENINRKVDSIVKKLQTLEKFGYHLQD